jgi:hypothetical protein
MPVLARGAAAIWQHVDRAVIWIIAAWTAGVAIHGIAHPWRLFHIANGESIPGEALSRMFNSDYSRLFPSLIRPNRAAAVGAVVVLVLFIAIALRRSLMPALRQLAHVSIPLVALLVAFFFQIGRRPATVVHFEDAHVAHKGGELYPPMYTVARFLHQGGWIARAGDSMTFLAQRGTYRLRYSATENALITIDGHAFPLDASANSYRITTVAVAETGRTELRVVSGSVNLDRLDRSR